MRYLVLITKKYKILSQKLKKVFYTEGSILYKLQQYKILFLIILINTRNLNYQLSIINYQLSIIN